ncbi:MAG: ATP-binding protein [Aeromonas sobria]|uniref:ATP-binding protein n=1 Tax=Aeromonas sobria TaxID=646 RepID=UPI003F3C1CE1
MMYKYIAVHLNLTVSLTISPFSSYLFSPVQLSTLDRDDFLEQKRNLLLIGGAGASKTHLAIALKAD